MCGFFGEDDDNDDNFTDELTHQHADRQTYKHSELEEENFYKHMLIAVTEQLNDTTTGLSTELEVVEVKIEMKLTILILKLRGI